MGTWDSVTMEAQTSIRLPDNSTTLPVAFLLSKAAGHRPVSTGKERDAESGNDYFGARYYASTMGRFLSPDPLIPFNMKKEEFQAWISNPQHWNKYAYALNNPLKYTDPTGMTETIYYFLGKNLTDAQKDFINKHLGEIESAIGGWSRSR